MEVLIGFWKGFLVDDGRAEGGFLDGVWWVGATSGLGVEGLAIEALVTDFVKDCFWSR